MPDQDGLTRHQPCVGRWGPRQVRGHKNLLETPPHLLAWFTLVDDQSSLSAVALVALSPRVFSCFRAVLSSLHSADHWLRGYGTHHVQGPRTAIGRGRRMPSSDGIQQTWWSTGASARGAGALDPRSKPCTACTRPTGMAASLRSRLHVLSKHGHQTETRRRPVPGGAEKLVGAS